jgi:DNA repair protein RadD
MIELRPYQRRGLADLIAAIRNGSRRPIWLAPTGAGKTTMAAELVRRYHLHERASLVIAPRRELVDQMAARINAHAGIYPGTIMAGRHYSPLQRVQVASFDTLHARGMRSKRITMPRADLVLVDECHLSASKERRAILDHYRDAIIVGMTATPASDNGRGLGGVYDSIVPVATIRELTDAGYLCPVRYFAPSEPDLEGLKISKATGDYNEDALAERMDVPQLCGDIVKNWLRIAPGESTAVFCVTRAHSRHVCEQFKRAGIRAEHLDGETDPDERKGILDRVASGETTVLCNVFVATYGLDIPRLSCAVLARPTNNISLYLQIVGRILRTFAGKDIATVIDHAGAVVRHGPVDSDIPWSLDQKETVADRRARQQKEKGEAKDITCRKCSAVFRGRRDCPKCGFAMLQPSEAVPFHAADLQEYDPRKENGAASWTDKAAFVANLRAYAAERGLAPGWVAHKYRAKFGVWPNDPRVRHVAAAASCDTATRKWITSQNIRRAKSAERAAA